MATTNTPNADITPYQKWQIEHFGYALPEYDNPFSSEPEAGEETRMPEQNQSLIRQKTYLQIAINYITIISNCDQEIARGFHVDYYKAVRTEAIEKYANAMANLVEGAIIGSKVLQPQV